MNTLPTNMTVADFCIALERSEIKVDKRYQRSDRVWPKAAQSFLIETILLGFPVPKISLFQRIDLETRKTIKDIVDGQQRSKALRDFFDNKLRLTRTLETTEIAGSTYQELPESWKEKFLNYSISIDLFVGAKPAEIRETFRRMNSYTVPLNPEEERHSMYQGEFKWFVYHIARDAELLFDEASVFTEKQFVRMADAKLITEVCHAILNGIETTNKAKLTALYKAHDANFENKEDLENRLKQAIEFLEQFVAWHRSALAKPYHTYSLILAVTHIFNPIGKLTKEFDTEGKPLCAGDTLERNLGLLCDQIESEDPDPEYKEFVDASNSRTNVAGQRTIRFRWFCMMLTRELQ